jgi:subtilase family serine protease
MTGKKLLRALVAVSFALVLAIPVAVMVHPAENASAYSGINIEFQRPSFAGKSQVVACTLLLNGGPAGDEGGNYTYRVDFSAKNVTGAKATPNTASDPSGFFRFNLTMPDEPGQTLTVTINATSRSTSTRASITADMNFKIKVVDPIVITAEVFNKGSVDARNVTASFFADGALLGTSVFNISAGSSAVLTYNWTFLKIDNGKHVVTVVLDEANSLVEFSDGNNVLSRTIYVGGGGNPAGAILTVAVIVVTFFVVLTYFQKPGRKPKKT